MDQSSLANFVTVVTGFSVIGGVIDGVTGAERRRKKLHLSKVSYADVVLVFYLTFFDRILKGAPTSWQYLRRSLTVSLALLACSFFALCYYNTGNLIPDPLVPKKPLGLLFLASVVLGYFVIFWLISAQTRLFVEESIDTRSRLSRLMFVFSDMLTSANIFVFLFAFTLHVASWGYIKSIIEPELQSENLEVVINVSKASVTGSPKGENQVNNFVVSVGQSSDDGPVEYTGVETRLNIQSKMQFIEPSIFLPRATGVDFSTTSTRVDDEEVLAAHLEGLVAPEDSVEYSKRYSFAHPGFPFTTTSYTNAYNLVDSVEDYFGAILNYSSQTHHLDKLFDFFGGNNPYDFDQLCVFEGGILSGREMTRFSLEEEADCFDDTFILSGKINSARNHLNGTLWGHVDYFIYVAPFYVASMAFSFAFYFSVLSSYVFFALRNVPVIHGFLVRAYSTVPFTSAGMVIGVLVWVIFGLI